MRFCAVCQIFFALRCTMKKRTTWVLLMLPSDCIRKDNKLCSREVGVMEYSVKNWGRWGRKWEVPEEASNCGDHPFYSFVWRFTFTWISSIILSLIAVNYTLLTVLALLVGCYSGRWDLGRWYGWERMHGFCIVWTTFLSVYILRTQHFLQRPLSS